jgi:hypothetical protein
MQDQNEIMDKVIELSRAVERAKAELDAKRFELFMFIQEIGNPQEVRKAKERVAKEAIAGLQPLLKKTNVRRDSLDVHERNARRKGTPSPAHMSKILQCLRSTKTPCSTSTIMHIVKLDYAKALWVLEYLEKSKKVRVVSTTAVKHRGRLISVRRWEIA